jgi:hypothetical protein
MNKLNKFGRARQFEPFRLNKISRLWFKGGDNSIDDTEDQKALAEVAAQRWERYQTTFVPAENAYIQEAVNYDKQSRMDQVTGQAASSSMQASSAQANQNSDALSAAGIDPSSGAWGEAISQGSANAAKAQSTVVNQTGQALQDRKVAGMKNVVAIGNGQASDTIAGMGDIATSSAKAAMDRSQRGFDQASARDAAIGTVVGAGTRAAIGVKEDPVK